MANIIAYIMTILCLLAVVAVWKGGLDKQKANPNWKPSKEEKIVFISKTFGYLAAAWATAYVGANF